MSREAKSWRIIKRSPRNDNRIVPRPEEIDDEAIPASICCMPIFKRRRSAKSDRSESVNVSQSTSSTTGGAEVDGPDESPIKELIVTSSRMPKSGRRRSLDVISDKASDWYSCVSSMSYIEELDNHEAATCARGASASIAVPLTDAERTTGWDILPRIPKSQWPPCTCGYSCHTDTYDANLPLFTDPSIVPGSYEEALVLSHAAVGNWVTILDRSDSLDPQMAHLGINRIKRGVMNRLAVPLSARLEDDNTVLHAQIHTPLGPKSMHAHLLGKEMIDTDSDCGIWTGVAKVVDFGDPRFCNGRPIRAVQLLRKNPKFGICFETRVVVPDAKEGRVMLFNLSLFPIEKEKPPIIVTRVLKYVGPL